MIHFTTTTEAPLTTIHTSSYRAFRPDMGLPVVTSLGLPKWRPEAAQWPRCWLITPTSALFRATDEEFDVGYPARLDRFGAARITRTLEQIAQQHDATALVLLCHEALADECDRSLSGDWLLARTGEQVTEIT